MFLEKKNNKLKTVKKYSFYGIDYTKSNDTKYKFTIDVENKLPQMLKNCLYRNDSKLHSMYLLFSFI